MKWLSRSSERLRAALLGGEIASVSSLPKMFSRLCSVERFHSRTEIEK